MVIKIAGHFSHEGIRSLEAVKEEPERTVNAVDLLTQRLIRKALADQAAEREKLEALAFLDGLPDADEGSDWEEDDEAYLRTTLSASSSDGRASPLTVDDAGNFTDDEEYGEDECFLEEIEKSSSTIKVRENYFIFSLENNIERQEQQIISETAYNILQVGVAIDKEAACHTLRSCVFALLGVMCLVVVGVLKKQSILELEAALSLAIGSVIFMAVPTANYSVLASEKLMLRDFFDENQEQVMRKAHAYRNVFESLAPTQENIRCALDEIYAKQAN